MGMNIKSRRAFILAELLVVITIIVILASILLPILAMAKKNSYRAQCVNNFKQLGIAIQLYADDHGDQLPGPAWADMYKC